MRVLILGASGYVGRNLVPHLVRAGYDIRCLLRDPRQVSFADIEVHQGNALDAGALDVAFRNVDRVVHLIHSMAHSENQFERLDRQIAVNVAAAARKNGVEQIVYLGGLGSRGQAQSAHLRSRHAVADVLRAGSVPVTELRAAVIVGAGSASFDMIRYLVRRLPLMITPRWVRVKTQPIAICDVVKYLIASLVVPAASGQMIDIGGPDVISYGDMMKAVARALKVKRLILPVPVLTPWLSSHWVNLVTPMPASLARALIESVRHETVCENDLALRIFDIQPLDFESAVREAVRETVDHGHLDQQPVRK